MAKTDDELDQVLAGYGLSSEEDGFLVVHLLNQYLLEKDGGTGKGLYFSTKSYKSKSLGRFWIKLQKIMYKSGF